MDHGPSCWAGASKLDFAWIQLDWTGLDWTGLQQPRSWPGQLRCRSVLSLASKNEVPEPAAIVTYLVERPSSPARRLGDT